MRYLVDVAISVIVRITRLGLRHALLDFSEPEAFVALVEAFRVLLPAVSTLAAHHFRRLLLSVAQEHLEAVGDATEIAAVSVEATRRYDEVPGS